MRPRTSPSLASLGEEEGWRRPPRFCCPRPFPAHAADATPVVAAELAFAADGAANGVKASFLRAMADDAVVLAPGPVSARAYYSAQPDGRGRHALTWRPVYAGLAASADLGFTTGPFAVDGRPAGYYFTVWARGADGSWKWIFDGGTGSDAADAPGEAAAIGVLNEPTAIPDSRQAAMAAVKAAEAQLARGARRDLARAYAAVLARDARVQGSAAAPATTAEAVGDELRRRPRAVDFAPLGGRASEAGDLVFTYGAARWSDAGRPRSGHYARLWRCDREGFRLVFDELIPVPENPT